MKNIIFDLGGVILKGKAKDILKKIDLNESEYNELVRFFDDWNDMDTTDMSIEEKFNNYNFSNNIKSKYKDTLIKYYELRDLNTNLINLIKELKKKNKVYILSDNNKDASLYYKNILKDLDGYVFSYEYKTIKKDGKLFDIFLDKYKLNPKDCYFIDDTKENILVANSKGINGILYENNDEKIINYFKERGLI
ncbi:MAG: HAD-IA family hydrolase [Bacilli bacterium]|nr:HAD-IA family hydrolase [Bacilli bacterium]